MRIPDQILGRISEVLGDKSLSREVRDRLLDQAAADAWKAMFPETAHRLPDEVALQRWEELSNQLAQNPKHEQILRIIESRASGEPFYWLDHSN
jgi:hypothetical protein